MNTLYIKKSEIWGAVIMFILHVVLFPVLLSILLTVKPGIMTDAQLNFAYYSASAVMTFLLLGKFLRRNFDSLLDNPWGSLKAFAIGWGIYFVLAAIVGVAVIALGLNENNPNENAIDDMLSRERGMIVAMTVFLAPIVEECIFRGGIFAGLHRHNRIVAYVASVAIFSLYHVWQYAFAAQDPSYLLYAISYIPASVALCWIYESSGSIWTNIFFHMAFNLYALAVTG